MLRDVYWRQYPVDLLSDDTMTLIESFLPENVRYAPYMFYITALKFADDDGIFDLGDGIIFARLMRVNSVKLVFEIANYLRRYKVIYRLSDDPEIKLCGFVEWTYSNRKSKTLDERRQAVMAAIERERAKTVSNKDFEVPDSIAGQCNDIPQSNNWAGKHNDVPQVMSQEGKRNDVPSAAVTEKSCMGTETAPQSTDFLLPENDKNAKNVVQTRMNDKIAENVTHIQTDIHTDNTNSTEIHTHTYKQPLPGSGRPIGPTPCNDQNKPAVAERAKIKTEMQTTETNCITDSKTLASEALMLAEEGIEKDADSKLFAYLNDFFVKNCYGFRPKQSVSALKRLCSEIENVSDEKNPKLEVAGVLCSEYKKMCEGGRGDYWKGQPLLPAYMIKPRCWAELMQYAGKILATKSAANKFIAAAEKAKADYEAEKGEVCDALDNEYLKYDIDPHAPDAVRQLLQKKSELNTASEGEVSEENFDIF